MNIITSAGGPYVVLDQTSFQLWGANVRKTFSVSESSYPDDYEAAGNLTDGVFHPPCHIAKLIGGKAEALLISMPFEITVIDANDSSVYLAQVQYAALDWSFAEVSRKDFAESEFENHINFSSKGSSYKIFDAAYLPSEVGEDCLTFSLLEGDYMFSATYSEDQVRGLFLYKIERASSLI